MAFSCWQQGADAARAGATVTDCPYTSAEFDSVVWTNGFMTARHNMAVEAKRADPVDADLFGDDNSDLF